MGRNYNQQQPNTHKPTTHFPTTTTYTPKYKSPSPTPPKEIKRLLGHYTQFHEGPLFVVVAGIHGNETAGIYALERVFQTLKQIAPEFKGSVCGIAGNLTAINQHRRFLHMDLNRQWYPEKIARLHQTDKKALTLVEDIQQKELLTLLKRVWKRHAHQEIVMLDLHTTSAHGGAYNIITQVPKSKEIGMACQLPVILGMENMLQGTTMNYFNDLNLPSLCLEAGQHDDPKSIDLMEAVIWETLHHLGCIHKQALPNWSFDQTLAHAVQPHHPKVVRFIYRHAITAEDQFTMRPGYKNFQRIQKGEVLADDKNGPVISRWDARILMPLYQKQGEDGFFIVEEEH